MANTCMVSLTARLNIRFVSASPEPGAAWCGISLLRIGTGIWEFVLWTQA